MMNKVFKRILIVWLAWTAAGCLCQGLPALSDNNAAIVCFLDGTAWVEEPGQTERRALALFDWIDQGWTVVTEPDSMVIIAFSSGDRFEFQGGTEATAGDQGFAVRTGSVQKLESVPVMLEVASISRKSVPGSHMGGIRVRGSGQDIAGLYPGGGANLLADKAVLTFDPLESVARYRVEIEDEWGNNVFSVETGSTEVVASPGVLKPGGLYYWHVRTLDRHRPLGYGEAFFRTVGEDEARVRKILELQADRSKDKTDLLLLARLDMALGLKKEACGSLQAALVLSPDNRGIREALTRFGCQ